MDGWGAGGPDLQTIHDFLQSLGWLINKERSSLIPTQRVTYLGYQFCLVSWKVFLPQEKISNDSGNVSLTTNQSISLSHLKSSRSDDLLLSRSSMGKVASTPTTAVSAKELGRRHKFLFRFQVLDTLQGKKLVVEVAPSLDKGSAVVHSYIPEDPNGCKFLGMESPSQQHNGTGKMVP